MKLKNKYILIGLSVLMSAGIVSPFVGIKINNVFGNSEVVWRHYQSIAPSKTQAGIKEYWVNCADKTHVFEEPSGSGVVIEDASWDEQTANDVISLHDDRVIEAGTWKPYIYQNKNFVSQFFSNIENLQVDADKEQFTFRVGKEKGGAFDEVNKTYTPNKSNNNSAFIFNSSLLKLGNEFGFKYFVVTIKANSVFADYNFLCDYYAYTSGGSLDWKAYYSENTAHLEDGVTFTFDLSAFNGFVGTQENDYLRFHLRNQNYKALDTVVSEVTISNIGFSNTISFQNDPKGRTSITYSVDDGGVPKQAVIKSYQTSEGGFATTTGLTEGYFQDLHSKDFIYGKIDIVWSDNPDKMYYHKVIDSDDTVTTGYDRKSSIVFEPSKTKNIFFGLTLHMGAYNNEGQIELTFNHRKYIPSDLYERPFSSQNSTSLYGFEPSLHGTMTGGNVGNGNVGKLLLSDGAEATIYSNEGIRSTNNGLLSLRFYALAIHLCEYTPMIGDVVVFKAGTYSDPENSYDVHRVATLTDGVIFAYNGLEFIEINSFNTAKVALDGIWTNKTSNASGLAGSIFLMDMAGYSKINMHLDIDFVIKAGCGDTSKSNVSYTLVTSIKGNIDNAIYKMEFNNVKIGGVDITIDFESILNSASFVGATSITDISFSIKCFHQGITGLQDHINDGAACWKYLFKPVTVSNVTFAA